MQPGDAVAFHYRMVHGARGNPTSRRRRALSLRYVGDDARYVTRPGPTSPPFPATECTTVIGFGTTGSPSFGGDQFLWKP
jgi:ectoine hydroxylase-related dioxygenase (phytanoyl-CoA dioxygenase family)